MAFDYLEKAILLTPLDLSGQKAIVGGYDKNDGKLSSDEVTLVKFFQETAPLGNNRPIQL